MSIFIDTFSGGAASMKKGQRSPDNVLRILSKSPRISCFDFSEQPWLWAAISGLKRDGLVTEVKEPYPWHRYELTDAGESAIAKQSEGE